MESLKNEANFLLFLLENRKFALPLSEVDRVYRSVEIEPIMDAPDDVLGLINCQGLVVPIFDPRIKLGVEQQSLNLSHRFIILHTPKGKIGLLADDVLGVESVSSGGHVIIPDIIPSINNSSGVFIQPDGLVVVYDIERFVQAEEILEFAKASTSID